MWKVIYIAKDILIAKGLEKVLKERGIVTILNQLEIHKDEFNGCVEILVPHCEVKEAVDMINQALLHDDNLLDNMG